MAHIDVVTAVRARLEANFSAAPIWVENGDTSVPDDLSPYVTLQFPYNNTEQASAGDPGNNKWREEGAFRIVIHVARGWGTDDARQWADEIATLFRGQTFAGVRCWAPTSPVTDDRNDADSYFKLSFAVPYTFDIHA
jgi:hypothetical protein